MNKRLLSIVLTLMALLLILTSCQGGTDLSSSSSESDTQSSENSNTPEPQNITISHVQGEWLWPMLENLTDEYTSLSGNTVELLYVPADTYTTWITTQFAGNTEPDIVFSSGSPAAEFYKNGWIVDLTPYYDAESAYTGKPWKESFIGRILDGTIDPFGTGAMLGMPTGIVTVNLFYNTEIFESAGINPESLLSWSGVLEAAKTISSKNNDIVPMSIQNSINWNLSWMEHFMMEQLWFDVVSELDVIDSNDKLETPELVLGLKSGVINLDDQRMVDYYTFLKEMSKYFNNGFNTASWEYEALFNEGKAAMNLNGSWFPNQHKQNELTVKYATMPIPYVDSKISSKAENRLRKYSIGLGGPDMMVTKKAFDEGRGDAAINFLQFFSDPETGAKIVAEQFMWIPVVNDVDVPDELKGITEYIGDDMQQFAWSSLIGMDAETMDKYLVLRANFLDDDSITPLKMAQETKKLYDSAVEQVIKDNPDWKIEDYLN